jgi:hypothetical protein
MWSWIWLVWVLFLRWPQPGLARQSRWMTNLSSQIVPPLQYMCVCGCVCEVEKGAGREWERERERGGGVAERARERETVKLIWPLARPACKLNLLSDKIILVVDTENHNTITTWMCRVPQALFPARQSLHTGMLGTNPVREVAFVHNYIIFMTFTLQVCYIVSVCIWRCLLRI